VRGSTVHLPSLLEEDNEVEKEVEREEDVDWCIVEKEGQGMERASLITSPMAISTFSSTTENQGIHFYK
jgi:hypothetical protein